MLTFGNLWRILSDLKFFFLGWKNVYWDMFSECFQFQCHYYFIKLLYIKKLPWKLVHHINDVIQKVRSLREGRNLLKSKKNEQGEKGYQRRIQNDVKHEDRAFCDNSQQLKAVNYFCKALHLRYLPGFWIRLKIHACTNVCFLKKWIINVSFCLSWNH